MRKLLLFLAALHAIHSCPDGFEFASDGVCKRLYVTLDNIRDDQATDLAISKCRELDAEPIIIHSEEQHKDWLDRWAALGNDHWPIIGLVCNNETRRWEWSDGSSVDFKPTEGIEGNLDGYCDSGCDWSIHYTGTWIEFCDATERVIDIFCEVKINANVTAAPIAVTENYCKCGIVNDWFENDWNPANIWVDLVIILDTSQSMGASLEEAKSVITSFVGLMSTDTTAEFYSRIGVLAVADTVEVIYNLNMSSSGALDSVKQHKIDKIDVGAAFQAAMKMFADGSKMSSYRENAQQIIYYLTNSAPGANMNGVDDFKTGGGIIIVNDFILEGEVADPGLQKLASDNYFFTDLSENYINSLAVFCEANCFCAPDAHPFNDEGRSPRTRANRGCFHPVNNGIPQQKARETCQKEYVVLCILFLLLLLLSVMSLFIFHALSAVVSIFGLNKKYWLGLQYDGIKWNWDDKSTDPFADWNVTNGQPDTKGGANLCAYAQQGTGFNTPWTAANCAMGGVIYVCESAPCSIGYKNCL